MRFNKYLNILSSTSNREWQPAQVLTKALQLHPNAAGLWSYAAAWEFEHNANAAAARALMQRGLRMAKRAPQLWVEYFRLELMYVHKLRARRRVLGLEDDAVPVPTGAYVRGEGIRVGLGGGDIAL